jgi:F0F1-type ATP synthase epsilon subunit
MNNDLLTVLIRSRERVVYEGRARVVSCRNELGKFDVLPMHENFISLLGGPVHIVEATGAVKDVPATSGLFKVSNNTVQIFI